MSKHTPGPWEVADGRRIGVNLPNAIGNEYDSHCIAITQESAHINAEANAHLIAAAPELLAMLKDLVDLEGPQPGNSAWGDRALALIAKAEGEMK